MKTHYDLVIIGAGPAGMAASAEAARHGLSTLVLGEQQTPGGQVYRTIEQIDPAVMDLLGPDYLSGKNLARQFRETPIDYLSGATVWQVEVESGSDCTVSFVRDGAARQVCGKRLLIAAGARERPVPVPGWTLPGVMAATAADVLLKSHGMVPVGDTVLAGSGPLLFLTAVRLLDAGAAVKAVLDTTPWSNYLAALPYLPKALIASEYLLKGLAMKRAIKRRGTPIYRSVKHLSAHGNDRVERIRFTTNSSRGTIGELDVDTLLLHNGVVPDTQIASLLDCTHHWYDVQRYWRPTTDIWGNTSQPGIGMAGDAKGISGAAAAEASGHIAALEAACKLGVISKQERESKATPFMKRITREHAVRPFLDHLFRPDPGLLIPDDETIVCRCEEVTGGDIRKALRLDTLGPNQLKSQTRAGMGPCQGRMCGLTVTEIIADYRGVPVSEVGYFRIRPPIKPITVAQLAQIELAETNRV